MSERDQEASVIMWRIEEWFPHIQGPMLDSLKGLHDILVDYSRSHTLLSPKAVFVADALYFADAILGGEIFFESQTQVQHLYDLNQGHGFPTLVWAILYPHVRFTVLEADPRRSAFIERVIAELGLGNCGIETKSLERHSEGSIPFIIHKGTLAIPKAILMARKVVPQGGAFYHLKGDEWGIEVGQIPTQLCSLWSPELIGEYRLPVGPSKFALVKSEKIS